MFDHKWASGVIGLCLMVMALHSELIANCGTASCPVHQNQRYDADAPVKIGFTAESILLNQQRAGEYLTSTQPGTYTQIQSLAANWAMNLGEALALEIKVPYARHQHTHDTSNPAESWDLTGFGDVTAQTYWPIASGVGAWAGIKAPTGRTDLTNAAGVVGNRSIQPGSGTWDIVFGAELIPSMAWQRLDGMYGEAVAYLSIQRRISGTDSSGYHPGHAWNANVGMRVPLWEGLAIETQVNYQQIDKTAQSGSPILDTGSTQVFTTVGCRYALANSEIYGLWQIPLYQFVNGIQLTSQLQLQIGSQFNF